MADNPIRNDMLARYPEGFKTDRDYAIKGIQRYVDARDEQNTFVINGKEVKLSELNKYLESLVSQKTNAKQTAAEEQSDNETLVNGSTDFQPTEDKKVILNIDGKEVESGEIEDELESLIKERIEQAKKKTAKGT